MKTVAEVGRFLRDNQLVMRALVEHRVYVVDFLRGQLLVASGRSDSFEEAINGAIFLFALWRKRNGGPTA